MQSLERRVEDLEKAAVPAKAEPLWIRLVGFSEPHQPISRIQHRGQEWIRQEGESEEAFRRRAESEVVLTERELQTVFVIN